MNRLTALVVITLAATASLASAQDLVITNARVIVGNGQVVERGAIVVRGGRIESVSAGAPAAAGARTIDAGGMTAMPGFIDGHRHMIQGNAEALYSARIHAGTHSRQ